jgi:hypothetical protein
MSGPMTNKPLDRTAVYGIVVALFTKHQPQFQRLRFADGGVVVCRPEWSDGEGLWCCACDTNPVPADSARLDTVPQLRRISKRRFDVADLVRDVPKHIGDFGVAVAERQQKLNFTLDRHEDGVQPMRAAAGFVRGFD